MFLKILVCAILAYFLGTIQTAIILSTQVAKQDIRNFGSGNAGSTNMIRTFGWGMGALTFLGDLFKGCITVVICRWIGGDVCAAVGAVCCILGHIWPVQYGFRGGKGVASTFGVMLAINPLAAVIIFAVAFLLAMVTRFVSLASLLSVLAFFVVSLFGGKPAYMIAMFLLMLLIFFTHRENIRRLISGTENPFYGAGKKEDGYSASAAEKKQSGRNLK